MSSATPSQPSWFESARVPRAAVGPRSRRKPGNLAELVAAALPTHHGVDLDDLGAIVVGDPGEMLGAIASAGAQVRAAAAETRDADVAGFAAAGRPRAVVVAAAGADAIVAEAFAAIVGAACPVPVVLHRGHGLPGWVGAEDVVLGVSLSGSAEEALSAVGEAGRRGARVASFGRRDSPLAAAAHRAGLHIPLDVLGRPPRACIWSLLIPMLLVADALRLVEVRRADVERTADLLDAISERCRPLAGTADNPAKRLALHLVGGIPAVWGDSGVAGVAAQRFTSQIAANAKMPSLVGTLPEPHHHQLAAFDGPHGRANAVQTAPPAPPAQRMHLVLLRDVDVAPQLARRGAESLILAAECGIPATHLRAEGLHPLERLASLIGPTDYASAYLALALGIDPTPVWAIERLDARLAEPGRRRPPPASGIPAQRDQRHT